MLSRCYDNRELSWLKFNERVLEEAKDNYVPLLERLGFAAIFQSNLDEFFMVRVGSLYDRLFVGDDERDNKTSLTVEEQLEAIFLRSAQLEHKRDKIFSDIMRALKNHGVRQLDCRELDGDDESFLRAIYDSEIRYLMSPLIVDKRCPFPFLKNGEIYAAVQLESKSGVKIGILPVGDYRKRIILLPQKNDFSVRFVLAEDVILHYADRIFDHFRVIGGSLIRITRNADINVEEALFDHEVDFREVMRDLLKKRKKLAPVRLQVKGSLSDNAMQYIREKLELSKKQVFKCDSPLDLSFSQALGKIIGKPELMFPKLVPQKASMLDERIPIIPQIYRKDALLCYPFESMRPFIRLLFEAADDMSVVSVKITLYRLASNSSIVEALCRLAENGKNVLVLIELRARFDEENNIDVSQKLQEAGCTVIFGPKDFKVHSKLMLITFETENSVRYITQIGTGNYNEKTSAIYTDLSYITARNDIAREAAKVFDALATGGLPERSELLLISPFGMQNRVIEMIEAEIEKAHVGEQGFIGLKLNSLTDKAIIDKLVEASRAGVEIKLLIRGICCLIPGIEGETENISVTSIVGRFLEHSRIYIFGKNEAQRVFIGSADFMTRNTLRRVEISVPVFDDCVKKKILDIFGLLLSDNVKARRLRSDGNYVHSIIEGLPVDSQLMLYTRAYEDAKRYETPLLPVIGGRKSLFEKIRGFFGKKNKSGAQKSNPQN